MGNAESEIVNYESAGAVAHVVDFPTPQSFDPSRIVVEQIDIDNGENESKPIAKMLFNVFTKKVSVCLKKKKI